MNLIIFSLLLCCFKLDADDCLHGDSEFKCVQYLSNYDGDTIKFTIPGIHPLLGKKISIRVNGLDTPEIRTKNSCEKKVAKRAKIVVKTLLQRSKRIDLKNVKRGKYFRIVADVLVDGKDLKQILLDRNMAYIYDGGTKSKIDWCLRLPASE